MLLSPKKKDESTSYDHSLIFSKGTVNKYQTSESHEIKY